MTFNKSRRTHDQFYFKDKNYFEKPKYTSIFFSKLIEKIKFNSLHDIGCANGALLNFINLKFKNKSLYGSDLRGELISDAKKKNTKNQNLKFFINDFTNPRKIKIKTDLIVSVGVMDIFDEFDKTLNLLLNNCNKKGSIFICQTFNEYKVDIVFRHRDTSKKSYTKKIDQMGWNIFSIKYISDLLKKNKRVKNFKFHKIKYPKNLKVSKRNDPMRSWTTIYDKRKIFINALGVIHDKYFLQINLN